MLPFGILDQKRLGKVGNESYPIFREFTHIVSFYTVDKKIVEDLGRVNRFLGQLENSFAPDEIFFPSLIYYYADKQELVLTDNLGIFFRYTSFREDQIADFINKEGVFFIRKCEGLGMNKK